jgi:hypothetical protein
MLKHQLTATFLMQKHQMHWRHEKEGDQLRKYQAKKITDFDKQMEMQRKFLPKVCFISYYDCIISEIVLNYFVVEIEAGYNAAKKRVQEINFSGRQS